MYNLLLVFVGAGLGGLLRYGLGSLVHRLLRGTFPWSTFVINVTGCLAMGFFMFLFQERHSLSHEARLFGAVGMLGGYTTFSTFGYEADSLLRDREHRSALLYISASVLGGVAALWVGRWAAELLAS